MRPRLSLFLPVLLLLPVPTLAQAPRAVVRLRPFAHPIVLDSLARPHEYDVAPAAAFGAAIAAFAAVRIPVTTRDSAAGVVANLNFVRTGTLGGAPISRYLNCGQGLTGAHADNHRVTIAIAALIDPLPGGRSRVGFGLSGSSRDMTGHSVEPNACETTGVLENRLADLVRSQVVTPNEPPTR